MLSSLRIHYRSHILTHHPHHKAVDKYRWMDASSFLFLAAVSSPIRSISFFREYDMTCTALSNRTCSLARKSRWRDRRSVRYLFIPLSIAHLAASVEQSCNGVRCGLEIDNSFALTPCAASISHMSGLPASAVLQRVSVSFQYQFQFQSILIITPYNVTICWTIPVIRTRNMKNIMTKRRKFLVVEHL